MLERVPILLLRIGQRFQEPLPELAFIALQRVVREVFLEVLSPDLLVAAQRGWFEGLRLDPRFKARQVSFRSKNPRSSHPHR